MNLGDPDLHPQARSPLAESWTTHRLIAASDDRNQSCVVAIEVPSNFAQRFPDPVTFNHGHEPHMTVLFVKAGDMTREEESNILAIVRKACRRVRPFRLLLDPNCGLQDFGPGKDGEKALWLPGRSEPKGDVERLYRVLRTNLETEGVEIPAHNEFKPHVTWAYVANDITDGERARMSEVVSDRFRDGFAFDVVSVVLSFPSGERRVMLNPVA